MTIEERVRKAVEASDLTSVQLGKASGLNPVNVRQFKAGLRNLPLASLQRLADAVGLEILVQPKKKPRKTT